MEQAQLFKRLHAMAMDELNAFIASDEEISKAIFKLDLAARTRRILNSIQLEDMWQAQPEEGDKFSLYLAMRLSPETLCSYLNFKVDMNNLEWRLVFPKIQDLPKESMPQTFGEYLALLDKVEIVDINDFDPDLTCEFLDRVYEFAGIRNPPPLQ